jgi:PGF-CTERM protein
MILMLVSPAAVGTAVASSDDGGDAAEAVSYVRTVDEIRGHLEMSVDHLQAGERDAAVGHTEEVMTEQWTVIETKLAAANETLAADLESALTDAHAAAENDSASEYATLIDEEVLPILDSAESATVEDERLSNATFNAKVVKGLLERAGSEYKEGVTDAGDVEEEMDYLAASAYADQAAARYEAQIKPAVSEHAAEELDEMFETLETRLNESHAPGEVTGMTDSIVHELAEYTGLEAEASGASAETIERIETDLHEAVEAYEAGNDAEAKSIIKETYLSNFEGIEGTLIEEDPELVEALEADFNEKLPSLIDEGAPVGEVREQVESMEGKLHEAEEILASQADTDIDLGGNETTTADDTGDEVTTTAGGDESGTETTETNTPGFGIVAALVAVGLIAAARYRDHE